MTDPTIRAALEQQAYCGHDRLPIGVKESGYRAGQIMYERSLPQFTEKCADCREFIKKLEAAYQLGQQAERERCALLVAGHITDSCPKDCAACALARDMARQIINTSLSNMTDAEWVAALRTPEEPAK